MKITLRGNQEKIIEDTAQAIAEGHRRIIIQLWVGGGKTVIASEIMRRAKEKLNRSLFLAPRRQLVYQTVETLKEFDINAGLIMAGEQGFTQPLVQVGSIDTVTSRVGSGRMKIPDANIVLADECHAVFSPERIKLLGNYNIVLGLTSTPVLANGKGMGKFYTKIIEGPTMEKMVDDGFLVPMRYFAADAPDVESVKLNADGDYSENQLAEASDKPELIGAIYDNYKRIAGDRTTIIFAVNRKHAQHIHNEFLSHGVNSEYLDGNTSTEERDAIKKRVESGETKVVVNIGVMSFGTNWPSVSCIIVARVTRNWAAWIQMIGRGSRLFPGKEDCYVIYHGHNFEELGRIDDDVEFSLDDKETIKERKEKKQQETKEPKDIKCQKCNYMFRSRRVCPNCGNEMIAKGEEIPTHKFDLQEIATKIPKPKPIEKSQFYSELLGYAKEHGKSANYALALFKQKFNEWPHHKKTIQPSVPSKETLGYITYSRIKYSHGKGKAA